MTNPCPYCLATDDRHEQSCPNERRTIRFDDGVPASPGDTEPVTQHCPACAELAGRVERLEAALREIEAILPIRIALMPASTALDMQHIARRALAGDDK